MQTMFYMIDIALFEKSMCNLGFVCDAYNQNLYINIDFTWFNLPIHMNIAYWNKYNLSFHFHYFRVEMPKKLNYELNH